MPTPQATFLFLPCRATHLLLPCLVFFTNHSSCCAGQLLLQLQNNTTRTQTRRLKKKSLREIREKKGKHTDTATLHLVYEMWDSMIEDVRKIIYQHERKAQVEPSSFFKAVNSVLIDRWTKSSTSLHCLAHSLNPRYYTDEWLSEDSQRRALHEDMELNHERKKCFMKYLNDVDVRRQANIEFANFSNEREGFADADSVRDKSKMDAKSWWIVHGSQAPTLQKIALKLLGQPCSSSCCERNWSTYSFIHSLKRNKMTPKRAQDLVFVHSNLRLLSRNSSKYKEEETKLWDIGGDDFSLEDSGILQIASLSLDEPELEEVFFNED